MKYRHRKTGNIYLVLNVVTNATNAQDGQEMILYQRDNDPGSPFYVRERDEFSQKFEKIGQSEQGADIFEEMRKRVKQLQEKIN